MSGPSDQEIIADVLGGRTDRFGLLMERHERRVLGVLRRHVPAEHVEEAAQETFIEIFRSLDSYRGDAPFEHWVSALTLRRCYRFWRSRGRRREDAAGSAEETVKLARSALGSEESAERRRAARELLEIGLAGLSAGERMALLLVHFEGRSMSEAAKVLGMSAVGVKVRCFRARAKFRAFVEAAAQEGEDEE